LSYLNLLLILLAAAILLLLFWFLLIVGWAVVLRRMGQTVDTWEELEEADFWSEQG
jgi:hypothetical protein